MSNAIGDSHSEHSHDGHSHHGQSHDGHSHAPVGPGFDPALAYGPVQAYGPGPAYGPAYAYATPAYVGARPKGLSGLVLRIYERTPVWGAPGAILLCFLGAAGYVWLSNPTDSGAYDLPTCIVKLTTGLDCPGCGGTRAFYYLMHGNLAQAARYHAPAVFAAPFLVWLYVAWVVKRMTGKKIPTPTISPRALSLFLLAWAIFSVVRNLPFAPFTSLYV